MVLAASAAVAACSRSVLDARQLRIGSSPTGVPFSFVDPWSNELTGSMVDTAALVARAIGRVPDLRITSFGALIPSLTAGKIDLIAAAMLRTPEREAVVSAVRSTPTQVRWSCRWRPNAPILLSSP